MDLCQVNPEFNLYDPEWPLRTYQPQAPPAKFVFAEDGQRCGQALDSVISPGCIVSGSSIFGSVLCPNVRVHSFCHIEQCILMPGVRVGRHADPRARSSTATSSSRAARSSATTPKKIGAATPSPTEGIVVVTTDDEPLIGPLSEDALKFEAEADRRGGRRVMNRQTRAAALSVAGLAATVSVSVPRSSARAVQHSRANYTEVRVRHHRCATASGSFTSVYVPKDTSRAIRS